MPVVIQEFEVIPQAAPQDRKENAAQHHETEPDPRELEQHLRDRMARLARLRAD